MRNRERNKQLKKLLEAKSRGNTRELAQEESSKKLLAERSRGMGKRVVPFVVMPADQLPKPLQDPPGIEVIEETAPPLVVVGCHDPPSPEPAREPEPDDSVLEKPGSLAGWTFREILEAERSGDLDEVELRWLKTRKNLDLANGRPSPWAWMR